MKGLVSKALLGLCLFSSTGTALADDTNARILMVVTSSNHFPEYPQFGSDLGLFAPEPLEFYREFKKKGYSIDQFDIISPAGGRAPVYRNDTVQLSKLTPELWEKLKTTQTPDKIMPEDYKAIFFVGGVSCLNDFPENQQLGNIAARIYENGGIVAGVCDGVSGLLPIKLSSGEFLVKDKLINCNEISEYDFLAKEAHINRKVGATVDARVVTAYAVQPVPVAKAVIKLLDEMVSTSVEEFRPVKNFTISPNPATDQVRISFEIPASGQVKIEILDILGNIAIPVSSFEGDQFHNIPVEINNLNPGFYTIRLSNNGQIHSKALIITR
ncbi:MAG TPA: T9SS type A sorting domain-containing protein [Patescibacteria group bacterium]|nr:T9SS type A sorting domain-containing protein [Patescibacteria group bacterium]